MGLGKQLARLFSFAINIPDDIVGVWDSEKTYKVHDIVEHNGNYYYATTTTNDEPGTGEDWEDLGDSGFARIGGVTNFSPSTEKNDADITDFDSDGWLEHLAASRGLSFEIEGFYVEDAETEARDPGQYLFEQLALAYGPHAVDVFRVKTPAEQNIDFEISAECPPEGISGGGGNDDPAAWSATLTITGEPNIN